MLTLEDKNKIMKNDHASAWLANKVLLLIQRAICILYKNFKIKKFPRDHPAQSLILLIRKSKSTGLYEFQE